MVLAHAGHWTTSLIYLAPVVVVVGFLMLSSWRDRKRPVPTRDRSGSDEDHVRSSG